MPAENVTLYAKWSANNYTISFNSNGGSLVSSITQAYGTTLTPPAAPTKTGHSFGGWYTEAALNNLYEFTTMPAENKLFMRSGQLIVIQLVLTLMVERVLQQY